MNLANKQLKVADVKTTAADSLMKKHSIFMAEEKTFCDRFLYQ